MDSAVQEPLSEAESRYHRLIQRMSAVVFELTPQGDTLVVNDAISALTHYIPEELIGRNWWDVFFPAEQRFQVEDLCRRFENGDVSNYELIMVVKDGGIKHMELNSANYYTEDGKLEKIVGFGVDISKRKQAEDQLQRSQLQLAQAQQIAHLGSWWWDVPSNTITWSEEMYRIFGVSPQEFKHSLEGYMTHVYPDDRYLVLSVLTTALTDLYPFSLEYRILLPDGSIHWILSRGEVIPGRSNEPIRMIGTSQDITDRKVAEEGLSASEEWNRLLVESVQDYAIFRLDPNGLVISWNKGAEKIKGYTADEILGKFYGIFYPPERRDRHDPDAILKKVVADGKYEEENWRVRKDGSRFWATVLITPLYDKKGRLSGFSKVVRDITRRKNYEEQLRQSEARFRAIFEYAALGIELLDLDGRLLECNAAICDITGFCKDDLVAMDGADLHNPARLVTASEQFDALRQGKIDYFSLEKAFIRQDGKLAWGRIRVSLIRDNDGKPEFVIGMLEDVTENKQMEVELAELQRRLMDGREAERVNLAQELHDGPVQDLYGISFNLKAASQELPPESKHDLDDLQRSLQNVQRKLRVISRELRPPTLAPFGLEKAIRSHAEAFQEEHQELNIHLDLVPDEQLLPENVRLALFRIYQQMLVNVVRHASAQNIFVRFRLDDFLVFLEIRDDGLGFVVPTRWIELARSGHLGLIGAIERAESIGGKLEIESEPGKGTRIQAIVPYKEKLENEEG